MRRLCGEGSRSYLGRSRLMSERATVRNRSEKSAEVVVAASKGRRTEREGESKRMSDGGARHQMSAQAERSSTASSEAGRGEGSGEARLAGQAERDSGRAQLLMQALTRENMVLAWKRVKANAGSAGSDGLSVRQTAEHLAVHWPEVREQLLNGSYRPRPVRRVQIPKPDGGMRELGIPTVTDRLIQQALLQVLQPLIDRSFSEHSYGFRPGRRALDAVGRAQQYVQAGYRTVVDVDLEKFFDRVNHDVLMDRVAKRIVDAAVLRLIRRYLEAGIMVHGVVQERYEGTPQGGPFTPRTQKQTLSAWRARGPTGGCRAALRWGRRTDGNAMPDDDGVVADEDVFDDEAYDSLTLKDIKRVGSAAQTAEERRERLGQAQERGAIVSLVGERLQLGAQRLFALPQQWHALA